MANGVPTSSSDGFREGGPECMLPLAADAPRGGKSVEGRVSNEDLLSREGRASKSSLLPPLLIGLEKFLR